jgi:hypothetical protein
MTKNDKQNQEAPQQIQDDAQRQQRKLRFVEEGVKTQYSGIFNVGFGAEEVVFIFGNPSVDPNVVRIESKIAVSLKTAKRIALSLGNLIRRYETANGTIDISPSKAAKSDKIDDKPIQ